MHKNITLCWLIGLMLIPCTAMAQDDGDVTIYGKLHASADYADDGKDASAYASSNSSRVGLKGSESLNRELSFVWQVESAVNLDESGSTFATRNSFVGLSHKAAGTVLVGRHDTPFKTVGRKVDMFGDRVGDSRNVIGTVGAGWNLRPSNVLAYKTPKMGGVHGLFAYVTEDGEDKTDVLSGYLMFNDGPVLLALAGERHGKALNEEGVEAEVGLRAVGSYGAGNLKGSLLYEMIKDAGGLEGADSNTWGLGLSFDLDAVILRGQYYGTDGIDGVDDSDGSLVALGVDHEFSKNTTGYLVFATSLNGDAAKFRSTGGGHGDKVSPAEPGEDTNTVSLGIIHKF